MTFTQEIPQKHLLELDVHEGDTLRVVARLNGTFLVQVTRSDAALLPQAGKASEWLGSSIGSVRLGTAESVDQARLDYYAAKYGLPHPNPPNPQPSSGSLGVTGMGGQVSDDTSTGIVTCPIGGATITKYP